MGLIIFICEKDDEFPLTVFQFASLYLGANVCVMILLYSSRWHFSILLWQLYIWSKFGQRELVLRISFNRYLPSSYSLIGSPPKLFLLSRYLSRSTLMLNVGWGLLPYLHLMHSVHYALSHAFCSLALSHAFSGEESKSPSSCYSRMGGGGVLKEQCLNLLSAAFLTFPS